MSGHPPFGAQIILNGHEYVRLHAARAWVGYLVRRRVGHLVRRRLVPHEIEMDAHAPRRRLGADNGL